MEFNEDMLCPVCKAKLFTDEVAVCPECGAPHHRECYLKLGHCFYKDKHGTSEQWQPPKIEPFKAYTSTSESKEYSEKYQSQAKGQRHENSFFTVNGIDKDEEIDGEKTENIVKFVGYNALRYLNIFRKMANLKKKVSWNWLGFLFPNFWLISRKCYFPAILVSLYSVFIGVASETVIHSNEVLGFVQTGNIEFLSGQTKSMLIILFCMTLISVLISLFFGMFGDYIYKKKVFSSIKELNKEHKATDLEYMRAGGVNIFLPIVLYFAMYFLSFLLFNLI